MCGGRTSPIARPSPQQESPSSSALDAPLLHVSHRLSSLKPLAKTPWSQHPKPRVSLTRQNPKPTTRFRHLRYFGVDRVDFHACFTRGLQPDFVPPKGFVPVVATSATLESRTSTQTNFRISWKERGCSKSEKCIVLSVRDSAGAHLAESPKWLEKVLVSGPLDSPRSGMWLNINGPSIKTHARAAPISQRWLTLQSF